jgi:protein-S-isoprenylcysteine O-methyltransferase Ste14
MGERALPSRLRVPLGYAAGLVALWLAHPIPVSLIIGLAVAAVGEAIRLWASGHIEKTRSLATGGPYAHCRNPLYLGSVLMGLGAAAAAASPWVVLAMAVYFSAFYPSVVRSEAEFLRQKFPEEYAAWSRDVPLFLPRITPGGPRSSRFSWERVARNKEWRTALALPGAAILLYVRSLW